MYNIQFERKILIWNIFQFLQRLKPISAKYSFGNVNYTFEQSQCFPAQKGIHIWEFPTSGASMDYGKTKVVTDALKQCPSHMAITEEKISTLFLLHCVCLSMQSALNCPQIIIGNLLRPPIMSEYLPVDYHFFSLWKYVFLHLFFSRREFWWENFPEY